VPQKSALILVVVAVAAAFVAPRAPSQSTRPSPEVSNKTSPCGDVGLPAVRLGLQRARGLTFCLLNEERTRRGLHPLRYEARLELASQRHSDDLVRRDFYGHENPDGMDPHGRILATGYPANNAIVGENIALGEHAQSSPAEAVDAWMHSPGHRENILREAFTEVGVGVAMSTPELAGYDAPSATYTTDFGGPPTAPQYTLP
jgi:uncharacterized protein YkwD